MGRIIYIGMNIPGADEYKAAFRQFVRFSVDIVGDNAGYGNKNFVIFMVVKPENIVASIHMTIQTLGLLIYIIYTQIMFVRFHKVFFSRK